VFAQSREIKFVGSKIDEIYQDFKSGIILAYLLFLYVREDNMQPDFRMIYESP
jgi:hypothetical protein